MKEGFKAIIFDLDGTLINSLPYHFLSFKDLLLEHNIRVSDNHLKKLIGYSTEKILRELKKKYKFGENIQDMREERRYHYFKFVGRRDLVFPGVKRILEDLRLNCELAVATGSSMIVFEHSTDKEFQELFDKVITINDVKKGKPHPDQLILAAKRLRVAPEKCLVIGDSIYDAQAAKNAGMAFVGVTTGYHSAKELKKEGALTTIDSIKQLPKTLKILTK
jgi:HAD superfamily hydrolase (TIGR01509 family)